MKWVLLTSGLFLGMFLEALVIKVPLVMLVLLLALIFIQRPWIILLSIPAGFMLDSLLFRSLGESSLFFAVMLTFFFWYSRKFEIQTIGFLLFSSTISTLLYSIFFSADYTLLTTITIGTVASGLFYAIKIIQNRSVTAGSFRLDH